MKTYQDFGIDVPAGSEGEVYTACPQCSGDRKKKHARCLSVNVPKGVWCCHHCGWTGRLNGHNGLPAKTKQPPVRVQYAPSEKLSPKVIEYFQNRGISEAVLKRNRIGEGMEFMPQIGKETMTIQFPYFESGGCVNVKYRDAKKNFKLVKDAKITLYGFDDIPAEGDDLIWVEGEIDKLSMEEAGFLNVVSVPHGAPSPNARSYASKFEFLETCEARLKGVGRHILAVDGDEAGKTLENELARRIGFEKCYYVRFGDCKDANEFLVRNGKESLRKQVQEYATPFPVDGLYEPLDFGSAVAELYAEGLQGGVSTGWLGLDKLFTVRPGELTVVTGIPSHGKSRFLDNLMVNLAVSRGWNFGIYSPENLPVQRHIGKLIEKFLRKPFSEGYPGRMSYKEMLDGLGWVQEHFNFLLKDNNLNLVSILELARVLVYRKGIKGLVIDPWNELEHKRERWQSETEYVSECLSLVKRFAKKHGVHVFIVAHPAKMAKGAGNKYPVPTPYDISGSAHWRNKTENCLTIWRDLADQDTRDVVIHVQKIKFEEVGRIGVATLVYDPLCGVYHDQKEVT